MNQSKMIFTIEQLASTPRARPRPTIFHAIAPNISRIAWNDGSPQDHNQSDIISLDCTSLLEQTQDILDIEDSSEDYVAETTEEYSLSSKVLNNGFIEHIQQQVNDKLKLEEHNEYRRKEKIIFKLSKCFAECLQENRVKLHKRNTVKKVFTKISRCIISKQKTKFKAGSQTKVPMVPFVSSHSPDIVDISKEFGLLNGKTFLKEGMKCTWC